METAGSCQLICSVNVFVSMGAGQDRKRGVAKPRGYVMMPVWVVHHVPV